MLDTALLITYDDFSATVATLSLIVFGAIYVGLRLKSPFLFRWTKKDALFLRFMDFLWQPVLYGQKLRKILKKKQGVTEAERASPVQQRWLSAAEAVHEQIRPEYVPTERDLFKCVIARIVEPICGLILLLLPSFLLSAAIAIATNTWHILYPRTGILAVLGAGFHAMRLARLAKASGLKWELMKVKEPRGVRLAHPFLEAALKAADGENQKEEHRFTPNQWERVGEVPRLHMAHFVSVGKGFYYTPSLAATYDGAPQVPLGSVALLSLTVFVPFFASIATIFVLLKVGALLGEIHADKQVHGALRTAAEMRIEQDLDLILIYLIGGVSLAIFWVGVFLIQKGDKDQLKKQFPRLARIIETGKDVRRAVAWACGHGQDAVALALHEPSRAMHSTAAHLEHVLVAYSQAGWGKQGDPLVEYLSQYLLWPYVLFVTSVVYVCLTNV
jgi:hypothetical protein